jgi:predicted O-linked N-acetylglucosamine transferase (SPINDLY family)
MIRQAMTLHQQGQLGEAERLYTCILQDQHDHFDALHLLGVLMHQRDRSEKALSLIAKALATNTRSADAYANQGRVLVALRRHKEALASYDLALALKPDHLEALFHRGNTLHELKRSDEALMSYDRALTLRPDYGDLLHNHGVILHGLTRYNEALVSYDRAVVLLPGNANVLNNRGNALGELKRFDEALANYDRALTLRPDYAEALYNRGKVLNEMRRHSEALASYDRALSVRPDYAEALYNRGNVLHALNHFDDALMSYDHALSVQPNNAEVLNNRGSVLKELKRPDEALASFDRALVLRPDYAEACCNRGIIFIDLNRNDDAVADFQRALAIRPAYAEARFAKCVAELPILYGDEDEIVRRRAAYEQNLRALCDDVETGKVQGDLVKAIAVIQPFLLAYQGYNDCDLQKLYGSLVCGIMEQQYPAAALPLPPAPGELVRVGIVSSFFYLHSNWKIPIKGWVSQLDRTRFKIFCYHVGRHRDAETDVAATMCDRFVGPALTVDGYRREILADAPHVLIYPGLLMDNISQQLAAQRLAPVQCNSWGHPETSGMPTLDYCLSSDLMEPPDAADHYTEQLIRLPNLSIYYEPVATEAVTVTREELGLRADAAAFWCGQSLFKYLPQFDYVFARIAKQVSHCQFVFLQHQGGPRINELFEERLDRAFAALGLRASDHCVFLTQLSQSKFVAAIGQCDVFLDSIGWSGCNSALESLPHNLPIVTMPSTLMRSRHSAAILRMMGVADTIADTIDNYISIAVRLANNPEERRALARRIADNKHKIYRDRACISALESFLNRVARQRVIAHSASK